jgi:mannosyltransferase OCH1-like enzyme
MDLDTACVRPFGSQFNGQNMFYVGKQFPSQWGNHSHLFGNAWMLATTCAHPLLTAILESLPSSAISHNVIEATGPGFFTKMIWRADPSTYTILPFEMVYVYVLLSPSKLQCMFDIFASTF